MKHWCLYGNDTGLISRKQFSGPDDWKPAIPLGMSLIEGAFDHLSQRVDLVSVQVVSYQPPSPGDEFEWNADTKRWVERAEVIQRRQLIASAQATIESLEQKQARPMRELRLNPDDEDATQRLADIDTQIAEQREIIRANKPS